MTYFSTFFCFFLLVQVEKSKWETSDEGCRAFFRDAKTLLQHPGVLAFAQASVPGMERGVSEGVGVKTNEALQPCKAAAGLFLRCQDGL